MNKLLATMACLLWAALASAQTVAPDVMVKTVSNEVLEIIRTDKDIQAGNSKKVRELVDAKVLPHFNFTRMTQLAMARDWRQATPPQQQQLTAEFRTLLVRTYSKALTEYRDETVEVKPLKMAAADTDVKVRTEIKQAKGKPVQIDYYLDKADSAWRVYDIEVAGVSLVTNYREFFASEVRNGGVDGLIKTMQAKNRSGEGGAGK